MLFTFAAARRQGLLVVQSALSMVLLVGAGLLVTTLIEIDTRRSRVRRIRGEGAHPLFPFSVHIDIHDRLAYIVGNMGIQLGEFEVLILLAVLRLGNAAYPPAVRGEIERRAKRPVQRGAVYVTLDRLEAKRLLASRADDESGRPRRIYRLSPRGLTALRRALAAVERMRDGLEPLLVDL